MFIIFMSVQNVRWEGQVKGLRTHFKMSLMGHCDFEKGSQNKHFQGTLLVGREGVTKKSTLYSLLTMLTILDDPLTG